MAKNLKLNIKNAQIAEAVNLENIKSKFSKKKDPASSSQKELPGKSVSDKSPKVESEDPSKTVKEDAPRIKARSRSAFAESSTGPTSSDIRPKSVEPIEEPTEVEKPKEKLEAPKMKTSEELRREIFAEELKETKQKETVSIFHNEDLPEPRKEAFVEPPVPKVFAQPEKEREKAVEKPASPPPQQPPQRAPQYTHQHTGQNRPTTPPVGKLGPTGRHIKDLLPPPRPPQPRRDAPPAQGGRPERSDHPRSDHRGPQDRRPPYSQAPASQPFADPLKDKSKFNKPKVKGKDDVLVTPDTEEESAKKSVKVAKAKDFRDVKPVKKVEVSRQFDGRDRQGLRGDEDEQRWRKRRNKSAKVVQEDTTIRPSFLKVRIPISIKDLASEMKLKASQLVAKLFMQGIIVTLNDLLEDETTIQLLGHEFGCEIEIDTSQEQRIRITDQTVKEEIEKTDPSELTIRAPVVAFMGHVDHGKTSLIDAIRSSNRAAGEAGAITQHIGAFRCHTSVGDIAILDTPGHEAFSAMRVRGADVTDIVVLVVAGDEGIRQQTIEAIQHAKAANVTIVVAINKSDKPNFNPENVYRQLSEQDLLPEAWGGQIITVNCSAHTGEGIQTLLEMLALQAEVLELRANPQHRARGRVLESEMHKGMGAVATVLIQNGTLRLGDALVFGQHWGRVKTMQDEHGKQIKEAGPSTPVEITGLSGLPEAGQEFITVKNEKEAREIAEARKEGLKESNLQLKKKITMENLLQQNAEGTKKILNIILRADVQGSLEALKVAIMKIESKKAEINIIFSGVGEISESDVQLAAASKAVIVGFHTQIESHSESIIKQFGVQVRMHDIIYHAIDDVKGLLAGLLDKISVETEKGKAEVKAIFKSSQYGIIAGCQVTEGSISRNNHVRVVRGKDIIWRGGIASLKRVKEDVREVLKGFECGIVLNGFSAVQEGDMLEAFEITYITQEL